MKICGIICEYNPFHNGHKYLIAEAKKRSGADAILCIMSGNFVQRGEAAILEKHLRASIAVEQGADMVIELPTVFATSNAEIFARGAISILSKIPEVTHLCFGTETADADAFLQAARLLKNEPEIVSKKIQALMAEGVGYASALTQAREEFLGNRLLSSPNNILGFEYTKAIEASQAKIQILPVARLGCGYLEQDLSSKFASASAIRKACTQKNYQALQCILPQELFLPLKDAVEAPLDTVEKLAIFNTSLSDLSQTLDCGEGLENAFKKAALSPVTLETALTSSRYTAARIRRIALQNLLGIRKSLVFEALTSPLYLRPLAYNALSDKLLSALSKSPISFLSCGKDKDKLQDIAAACMAKDLLAESVYAILTQKEYQNKTIIKK